MRDSDFIGPLPYAEYLRQKWTFPDIIPILPIGRKYVAILL